MSLTSMNDLHFTIEESEARQVKKLAEELGSDKART